MRTLLLSCLLAVPAFADEATFVFRSVEDAATPADPAVCAAAPFVTNVKLGASVWSVAPRHRDGRLSTRPGRKIGTATACLALTNFMFPVGLTDNFYVQFDLPQGRYTAVGTCRVSSNAVPRPFIVLAGCTLNVVSAPPGSLGGMLTSSSVFNPLKQAGFPTGSVWTLHEYVQATSEAPEGEEPSDGDER